jgi:carboxylesterase
MTAPVIVGAEPMSVDGGPAGALVLHGFTGNPQSMRGLAEALGEAGFAVEMPLLPGHGTAVEDMVGTTWADWLGAAEDAYGKLAARTERAVVVGLSMGGALAAWLASERPEVAGLVCVNAVVSAPEGMQELVEAMLATGEEYMDAIGSDIADPASEEASYPRTPLRPLLSLMEAAEEFGGRLGRIACPVLVATSPQDHVVDPSNSELLAAAVSGPVERLTLARSYHVATLDYDKDELERAVVAFAQRVTA